VSLPHTPAVPPPAAGRTAAVAAAAVAAVAVAFKLATVFERFSRQFLSPKTDPPNVTPQTEFCPPKPGGAGTRDEEDEDEEDDEEDEEDDEEEDDEDDEEEEDNEEEEDEEERRKGRPEGEVEERWATRTKWLAVENEDGGSTPQRAKTPTRKDGEEEELREAVVGDVPGAEDCSNVQRTDAENAPSAGG